jgi:hypothetical protein
MKACLRMFALCAALFAACAAFAFKLQAVGPSSDNSPLGLVNRQAQGFLNQFSSDVHERITRQAYEIAGVKLADDVIAGLRWNDNPPAVRIGALFGGCNGSDLEPAAGMECWTNMVRIDRMAWEALSRREKAIAPLRSHFGDMQFLHSMASHSGEPAAETRRNALRYAEFAYRVARGEIGPRANMFALRNAGTALEADTSAWASDLFSAPAKKLWTVQDIYLPRSGNLRLIAFGSLLHLVEDSYSAAHVRRRSSRVQANGCPSYDADDAILQFHTYVGQDTEKHGLCDDAPDWLETARPGSPVEVLAQIVRAYRDGSDWKVVKSILEERVFRLADTVSAAHPGRCFELPFDPSADSGIATMRAAIDPACREEPR